MKTKCKTTKFVYLFGKFLSVAMCTAEVILKFSDCKMASCDRYRFVFHEALFTASEKSLNLQSSINRLATMVTMQYTW